MDYKIRLHPRVLKQIGGWGLSESLLVDVYLKLREELCKSPFDHLHRDPDGSGSLYVFETFDPADPGYQQLFMFRVFFDADEAHLNIVNGSYWRNYDPQ
jgi:hypothetical protein